MKICKYLQINTGKYSVYASWDDTDTEAEIKYLYEAKRQDQRLYLYFTGKRWDASQNGK